MVNFSDNRYERFIGLLGYEREFLGDKQNGIYIPQKEIYVIKGQEVPTQQGHMLVLGLENDYHIQEHRSVEDTIKEAKDKNGIIVADHPFYRDGIGPALQTNNIFLDDLDAIEVFNAEAELTLPMGNFPKNANQKAKQFHEFYHIFYPHLGALTSSDGHSFYELGQNWTMLQDEIIRPQNFVEQIRNGIHKTNVYTQKKESPSIKGSLDHIIDLVLITKIAPLIGMSKYYEVPK